MPMPYTYRHATEEFRAYIADAKDRLDTPSDNVAYTATDAVFQTFRRRLAVQDALRFADVLPCVLRAVFLWRWKIADPVAFASRDELTAEALAIRAHHNFAPPTLIGDVAWALRRHVDTTEFTRTLAQLGPEAQAFWAPGE
ncbi:DUF2267 domain-containing protein [Solirhodobacter olei]|uniref:DUF2267 domain-containing protein n=1 Tax=Solirhodobacter olei TaxID=2493082 RepID=UPI000FD90751|nr:DUF2267 domain-containing protein [Solirhodobacter olei]